MSRLVEGIRTLIKKSVAEIMRVTRFSVLQIGRRHQFSAAADAESYGLTYADHSPSADWESVVNGERDSIVNGFGGSVVDEKRTSVEGYPGKWTRFAGQDTRANSPSTSSGAACMCCMLLPRRGRLGRRIFLRFLTRSFCYQSRSRSRIMGLGGSETICRLPPLEDSGIAAIFCGFGV